MKGVNEVWGEWGDRGYLGDWGDWGECKLRFEGPNPFLKAFLGPFH